MESLTAQKKKVAQSHTQTENNEKENGAPTNDSVQPPSVMEIVPLSSLQNGPNFGKIVALKLLMPVVHETHDPPA